MVVEGLEPDAKVAAEPVMICHCVSMSPAPRCHTNSEYKFTSGFLHQHWSLIMQTKGKKMGRYTEGCVLDQNTLSHENFLWYMSKAPLEIYHDPA